MQLRKHGGIEKKNNRNRLTHEGNEIKSFQSKIYKYILYSTSKVSIS